ncbi:MAG: alanine--tRNA ligase [Planctomycetota bacterium]
MMKSDELRRMFLDFFKSKDHKVYPSDSLVPSSKDPSLFFTGAGMNQFKNYFLGSVQPPSPRATTSQKCLRTVDIERVGRTPAHHTFFEMLGNFSFGDYFKREAIHFAWEFLIEKLHLSPERLSVTIYDEDEESYNIWHNEIRLPTDKIFRFGEDNNFWPANAPTDGPNGPCGPCSEIFYDFGEKYGCGSPTCSVDCGCNRFVEIWNLVFMEFERQDKGVLVPLKKKNIDTGMGLERISAVMQGVTSNFETDLFKNLIKHTADIIKIDYKPSSEEGTRVKRIADHSRALTFLVADGVLPSNEGRGYVERRILRRAVRDGMNLRVKKPFLYKIVPVVVELMKNAYPELNDKQSQISHVIKAEEEKFLETVDSGIKLLDDTIKNLKTANSKIFPGEEAFKLYDTYGFPVDLTESILHEKGFKLDIGAYEKALSEQRKLSRAGSKIASEIFARTEIDDIKNILDKTIYIGEDTLSAEITIEAILIGGKLVQVYPQSDTVHSGNEIAVITDKTPFYAESGGQVSDTGWLKTGGVEIEITDTQRMDKYVMHIGNLKKGEVKVGMKVQAVVDAQHHQSIACNHTATHLLHYALRNIIGSTIEQSGSLVLSDRLRFDYSTSKAPTDNELLAVEELVNQCIRDNAVVAIKTMFLEEAKKMGAMALFSEKYSDNVRVVSSGDYSKELCGGSHIKNTGEIGYFKVISDTSIASGTRRIEAVTGKEALKKVQELEKILSQSADLLQTTFNQLPHKIKQIQEKFELIQNQLVRYHQKENNQIALTLMDRATSIPNPIGGVKIVAEILENKTIDDLRIITDYFRNSGELVITLLGTAEGNKVNLILMMTPKLCKEDFNAITIIKEIASIVEGSGGGRKDLAQAGGKRVDKLNDVLNHFSRLIKSKLK